MKNNLLIVTILTIFLFTGCTSQKKLAYFNNVDQNSAQVIQQYAKPGNEAKIFPGDMLSIIVSSFDPKASAPFNLPIVSYQSPTSDQLYSTPNLQSYIVDSNGDINFPVIGKIKLGGLTKPEAIDYIAAKLQPYIKDPIINIHYTNYTINVLGEVARPGKYKVENEKITILEALALAGDLTVYGRRDNVLITRDNNGKPEFARINLNTDEVFKSPYFYLQQNDVIYIEPNNVKAVSAENIPLYLSGISTIATVLALIFTLVKK